MAKRRCELGRPNVLAVGVAILLFAPMVHAQEPVATPPVAASPSPKRLAKRLTPSGTPSPELENIRKALEALTPEQRQEFRQNFVRWMNLPTEEKKALRDQNDLRRKQMVEEIDGALKQTGLQLDPVRQKAFARRYTQERRKVEEQLRQETGAKRAGMIAEFLSKLKVEFGAPLASP